MKDKKKYKKRREIISMSDLENLIILKSWFYFGSASNTPKHYAVIISMIYRTLSNAIKNDRLWIAERIKRFS